MQKQKKLFYSKDKKVSSELRQFQLRQKMRNRSQRNYQKYIEPKRFAIEADKGEHLLQYRQKDFKEVTSLKNKQQIFDLQLEFGNYHLDYSLNGRNLLLTSQIGHVSIIEWKGKNLVSEFQVQDKITCSKFLHSNFIGIGQKNNLFIYNNEGLEVHDLTNVQEPLHLEYLPYHFLLTSITQRGKLIYIDCSTGEVKSEIKTKVYNSNSLKQNKFNALIGLATNKGVIKFYTPNQQDPVLQVLAHNSKVNDLDFTIDGNYMLSVGSDNQMKVFDIRKLYKEIDSYYLPTQAQKINISQTGIAAVNSKNQLFFWKDFQKQKQKQPYLKHDISNNLFIQDFQFVNYEDFLGLTFQNGFQSILIPGSGSVVHDTFEYNISNNRKQQRENEVKKLLEKLPHDTITLDPFLIGKVDPASKQIKEQEIKEEREERLRKKLIKKQNKKNKKVKNQIAKEIHRTELKREQIRENNKLRKLAYKAEEKKIENEIAELNQKMPEILDLANEYITENNQIKLFKMISNLYFQSTLLRKIIQTFRKHMIYKMSFIF